MARSDAWPNEAFVTGRCPICEPSPGELTGVALRCSSALQGSLGTSRALWLGRDVIAVDWASLLQKEQEVGAVELLLHASRAAALSLAGTGLQGTGASPGGGV